MGIGIFAHFLNMLIKAVCLVGIRIRHPGLETADGLNIVRMATVSSKEYKAFRLRSTQNCKNACAKQVEGEKELGPRVPRGKPHNVQDREAK